VWRLTLGAWDAGSSRRRRLAAHGHREIDHQRGQQADEGRAAGNCEIGGSNRPEAARETGE
jgi:hypothetical protein